MKIIFNLSNMFANYSKIAFFLGIISFTQNAFAQKEKMIQGKITGLKDGQMIYLCLPNQGECSWPISDSAIVENGEFAMPAHISGGPRLVALSFSRSARAVLCRYFLYDDNAIHVGGYFTDTRLDSSITIKGSKAENDRVLLDNFCEKELESFNQIMRKHLYTDFFDHLNDSLGYNKQLMDSIETNKQFLGDSLLNVMLKMPGNKSIPFVIDLRQLYKYINGSSKFRKLYNTLDTVTKKSALGRLMKKEIDSLCIGCFAPNFNSVTADKKQVTLSEVAKANKLTLISFWGWFRPDYQPMNALKREDRELLVPLYKKFHEKGFEIIGVSRQKDEKEWKKIIAGESFPWYEVSNLSLDEPILNKYNLLLINNPYNVLINESQKIVAWNVSNSLELQWYCDKYLSK